MIKDISNFFGIWILQRKALNWELSNVQMCTNIDTHFNRRYHLAMNIALTPQLEKLIQEEINAGWYNNVSEFVREAIRDHLLKSKERRLKRLLMPALKETRKGIYSDLDVNQVENIAYERRFGKKRST